MCDEIVNININNDRASCCSQCGAEKIRRLSDRFDDVSEGARKFAKSKCKESGSCLSHLSQQKTKVGLAEQ